MPLIVRTLDLRATLRREGSERFIAFDLSEEIARSIDVDAEVYSRFLSGFPVEEIPAGKYLFYQENGEGDAPLIAEEALEVQKEGLWRGLKLGGRLYLRVLAEERGIVRQLIRRIEA